MNATRKPAVVLCLWAFFAVIGNDYCAAQLPGDRGVYQILIEGRVERVYQSADGFELVELQVQGIVQSPGTERRRQEKLPAEGDAVYVQIGPAGAMGDDRSTAARAPEVGQTIRAAVRSELGGRWSASGRRWFKPLQPNDAPRSDEHPAEVAFRGMTCEAALVGGRLGLKVREVKPDTPAAAAGFQPGDIVVAIANRPVSSTADLRSDAVGADAVDLTVVDVNSGRLAKVTVAGESTPTSREAPREGDDQREQAIATRIAASLGIRVEASRVGTRGAVKVVEAKPGGPGGEAGLERGDQIVAVGETSITSPDELAAELPNSPRAITLVVRDVRTGRDVPIEVAALGTRPPTEPAGSSRRQSPPEREATGNGLGIHGELAFYDAEAAVKVTRVDRGSAAERAGIRAGMILLTADGQSLMHPDDLAQAEKQSDGRLTLEVVDPDTGRKSSLRLNF